MTKPSGAANTLGTIITFDGGDNMSNIMNSGSPVNLTELLCSVCRVTKPVTQFSRRRAAKRGYVSRCKPCESAACKEYASREVSRDKRRARQWRTRYGITTVEYQQMFDAQNGVCAICKRPETALARTGKPRVLVVDHCHETGKVRGLLCVWCNAMLGSAEDNPQILSNAIAYLHASVLSST